MEAPLREWSERKLTTIIEYPGRGKIIKRWPVRGYKNVGNHCSSA